MKLRSKTTGEIGHLISTNWNETSLIIMDKNGVQLGKYDSLAKLNAEWEDYEEPEESKKYWFINSGGETVSYYEEDEEPEDTEACKEIGNYFETEEEAEKAVEKLKVVKRLKDKGFKFILEDSYVEQTKDTGESKMFIACTMNDYHDFVFGDNTDIKLLFSGEDD